MCVMCVQDIQAYTGKSGEFPYPIIADPDRAIAKLLGMIDPDEVDVQGMPLTCRAVGCLFYSFIYAIIIIIVTI